MQSSWRSSVSREMFDKQRFIWHMQQIWLNWYASTEHPYLANHDKNPKMRTTWIRILTCRRQVTWLLTWIKAVWQSENMFTNCEQLWSSLKYISRRDVFFRRHLTGRILVKPAVKTQSEIFAMQMRVCNDRDIPNNSLVQHTWYLWRHLWEGG